MLRVKIRLVEKEAWQKYQDEGGVVFCPTAEMPPIGRSIELEVLFQSGPRVLLRGTVLWRRPAGDTRARPGLGIRIDEVDAEKLAFLNAYVRGGLLNKREQRRLPVRLRVTYTAHSGRRINFTRDLNEHGVFLRAAEILPKGEEIKLVISPPGKGLKAMEVSGTVARIVEQDPNRGMGIKLNFRSVTDKRQFAEFVAQVEQQYMAGELPDDALS